MKKHTQDLYARIETAKDLPSLPHILLKLLDAYRSDDATIKDIARIIKQDSSLCAKLLRLVNSPAYRTSQKVVDIEQALLKIGLATVRNITITSSIYLNFNKRKFDSIFNMKLYWWHALMSAVMARSIAEKTMYRAPEEAFLAGLLHDIGRLVLWTNFPDEYSRILTSAHNVPELILAGEIQMGASHSAVGAWLLKRWELPSFISDAILYHHEPFEQVMDALPLVKIIYAANIMSPGMMVPDEDRFEKANRLLGLDLNIIKDMVRNADDEARRLAKALDIHIETNEQLQQFLAEPETEKEEHLAHKVSDIALLQGTLQNLMETSDEGGILSIIQQGMAILFDVKKICFFLYEPGNDILIGRTVPGDSLGEYFRECTVSLQQKESILVKSLQRKAPMDSFEYSVKTMIIDEQIIHLIGTVGIVCLPMICRGEYVGVIVLGMDETEVLHLTKRMELLTMLTNQAALAIHLDSLRKRQEERLHAERIAAFSTLARQVKHEVNNPLGIIKNYLKILSMKLAQEDPVQGELVIINEEIDRISLIISELSHLDKPRVLQAKNVHINGLLSDLISIMGKSLPADSSIRFHLKSDSSLPEIKTEKSNLKQAVLNLLKNAVEAMPAGGNIFIETRHHPPTRNMLHDNLTAGGERVAIIISDDGPGIPDPVKQRLFEPHGSTKGKGHLGMGLSLAYAAVAALKGSLTCTSGDKGTTFEILLPAGQTAPP